MWRYLLICFFLFPAGIYSQILTGIGTRWDDSFREWIIYTTIEGEEGALQLRWLSGNDWSAWNYYLGERNGGIEMKWRDNPNEWEVRGDNLIVSARTLWRDDPREWRIMGPHGRQFTLKSRYGNLADEWQITSDRYGHFSMYTNWQGDPRDWVIIDELSEEVTLPEKLALVFVVLFHSSPKE